VRRDGGLVADVTVDAVDVLSGGKTVRHFDEVEAELVRGDERELRRIGRTLRKAGARKSDQRPKVFQAVGLAPPDSEPAMIRALPSIEYLKALVKTQVRRILIHDVGVRIGTNPEDVHQMRVAIRRLRALLRAAQPMLVVDWAEHLREELRWLATVLGKVRDFDVLLAHVRDQRTDLSSSQRRGLKGVIDALERERAVHRAALLTALHDDRYLALLERIEAAAHSPVVADPNVSLEKIARAGFRKLRRTVSEEGTDPSDAVLHRIRIMGKRARHAAELAATRRGKPAARFIRRIKDLQDLLGEHHDAIVAEQEFRKLLADRGGRGMALALGRLIGRQAKRRRKVRKSWPDAWRRVERCGRAAWS
jgi:CHAD domain-containing protein